MEKREDGNQPTFASLLFSMKLRISVIGASMMMGFGVGGSKLI